MIPAMPPVSSTFGQGTYGGMQKQQSNAQAFPQPHFPGGQSSMPFGSQPGPPMQNGQPSQSNYMQTGGNAYPQETPAMNAPGQFTATGRPYTNDMNSVPQMGVYPPAGMNNFHNNAPQYSVASPFPTDPTGAMPSAARPPSLAQAMSNASPLPTQPSSMMSTSFMPQPPTSTAIPPSACQQAPSIMPGQQSQANSAQPPGMLAPAQRPAMSVQSSGIMPAPPSSIMSVQPPTAMPPTSSYTPNQMPAMAPGQSPAIPGQPQMMQGQPPMMHGQSQVAPGQPQMGSGQQPMVPGQPPMVPGQPPMVPGQPPMGSGQPPMVPGQPPMGSGQPPMVPGQPQMGSGQPPTVPGQSPMMPGQQSTMRSTPNMMPGQAPSMMSGQAPNMMPGQAPSMMSGQAPNMMPGQAPNMMPGQAPSMMSGQPPMMPGQNPSIVPGQAPSMMSGQPPMMSGQAPSMVPGQAPNMMPGQAPNMMPGQAPSMMPGQAPSMVPGQAPNMMPGQPPMMPGQPQMMPGQNPSIVPGQAPNMMSGQAPNMMPGQAPNMMPVQPPMMPGQPQMIPQAGGMPGYPQGGVAQPGGMGVPNMMSSGGMAQQRPRLDPNLMPSAVQVVDEDRSTRSGPFPTGYPTAEFPPLTTTEYFAQDQGNCNPRFMRTTLYVAPATSDMLKTSQLPFAVAVSPFAPQHPDEMRPPVVDLGELGPVRCHRCKAYMCPFMQFQDGGRRFKCPFCLSSTPVEEQYFAHLDHNGRRTDILQRPEMYLGSYEFVATKPYCKNGVRPKEPAFIFMLDVTYTAVRSGLVSVFCKNIKRILNDLPRDVGEDKSSLRIGFATYDHTVHFYNLKGVMGQPQMLVVGDVTEVFVPLVEGFLVTLEEAETAIDSLMVEIENMFAETKIVETMLGPAIEAGLDALKCADRAGKIFVFHTNLPVLDAPGKLRARDDRKLLGTDKEKQVLSPAIDYYAKLGEECVKVGCAVDMFLFPTSFVDVATIAPVCTITGGSLYKYNYFEAEKDSERFLSELSRDVSRDIAFDVMMRVRTSTGLRPTGFLGSFFMDNSTDMEFGVIDADKAVHVEMRHDDRLPEGEAYLQAAALFTSISGQRRLRIHNMALPVTSDCSQLYRVADSHSLVSFLFKQAENMVRDKSPKDVRENITQRCAQMLATYREKCSEQAPLGQLILPECLKLLPLYGSCMLRNDAISGGSDVTVDDRAWMMQLVASLRIEDVILLMYPSVVPISGLTLDKVTDELTLPGCVRCSYENLEHDKAYVIYNGLMMFVWVGLGVSQQWVQDVFDANAVTHINTESHRVPERDNAHSRAVRCVIDRLNMDRGRHMKLFVIREKDSLEPWMKRFLVEDRSASMPSYVDYLCNIHREIRSLLS